MRLLKATQLALIPWRRPERLLQNSRHRVGTLHALTRLACCAHINKHPSTRHTHSRTSTNNPAVEFEEWGNPKNPEYYTYMKSYSPVDNVKAQRCALRLTGALTGV